MSKSGLFGHSPNNNAATARVLIALQEYWDIRHVGNIQGSYRVVLPFCGNYAEDTPKWNSYEEFSLCDNGQEINVEPVNHDERMRSIPSTHNGIVLTAETMAWRLWCAMTGQEIDWNYNDIPGVRGREPLPL